MNKLDVYGLSAGYGATRVLDGISFAAQGGQMVAVVGPNGVGKSTLVKVMLGLLPAARGRCTFDGQPIARQPERLAYVPQRVEIDWDYPATTAEVVAMAATPRHGFGWLRRPREVAASALEVMGLQELADRPIRELSGGQRQRALLARALLRKPDLIVLDEPMAAIDIASEAVIWTELERHAAAGGLVIVVHHDLASVQERFDACLLLAAGSAVYGPPSRVLNAPTLQRAFGRNQPEPDHAGTARDLRRTA